MKGVVLGIAGIGLIGGSIALRARAAGATVIGVDRDPAALAAARAAGALDDVAADLAALAERCTIVGLALPVDATVAALESAAALARPELVFDVASVKAPVAAAGRHLPRFVGSHPLAGKEVGGFAAAEAGLFEGRTWVVDREAEPAARRRLEGLIEALGARPLALVPDDHDRLVAVTSHLPQALAVALGARLAAAGTTEPQVFELCGPGMESMLRLARSPAPLWAAIARANAAPLASELRGLARLLTEAADGLDAGEVSALMSYFEEAHRAVAALEHSGDSQRCSPPYVAPTR